MRPFLAAALLLLALAPGAWAQPAPMENHVTHCTRECRPQDVNDADLRNAPTRVVLYAHPRDLLQRAPLTTLPPSASEPDVNGGFLLPSLKLAEDVVYFDNNEFILEHTPAPAPEGGASIRGLAYDLRLSGDAVTLYWYLSPSVVPGKNSTTMPLGAPGALPQVVVAARLNTGRFPGRGTLIAEGSAEAPIIVSAPGQDLVYEFKVRMPLRSRDIPATAGFSVGVTWYQAGDGERQVMQGEWRLRSGPRFAPRLILDVEEPVRILGSTALQRYGFFFVAVTVAPLFGAYDLSPTGLRLNWSGPDGQRPAPRHVFTIMDGSRPVNATLLWSLEGDARHPPSGALRFAFSARNLQETYETTGVVELEPFSFASAGQGRAPALGALGAAMALAVGWALARRTTR